MLYYFHIPSYAASTLNFRVLTRKGDYEMRADKALSPLQSGWTVSAYTPTTFPVNTNSYAIVKATTPQFPANVLYRSGSNAYSAAIVLQGQRILVPIFYSATGSYTVTLDDGSNTYDLSLAASTVSSVAGTFAISASYKNSLNIVGNQQVLFEGSGFNSVAKIVDDETNENVFTIVNDNHIVMTTAVMTATGSHTYTFKNAADVTLGTTTLTFVDENELSIEASFWQKTGGNEIVISFSYTDDCIVEAVDGSTYYQAIKELEDLVTIKNQRSTNFTRVVRDKSGVVVSYCPYSIKNVGGQTLVRGTADMNGVISINPDLYPSRIVLQYDRADLPVNSEYIEL